MTSALPLTILATLLDTRPPWLSPFLPAARRVMASAGAASIAAALAASRGDDASTPCFVEHSALPEGEPYESFIARTARVPTRDNLHDLFNGLVWLTYPQTKRRMNALQGGQIAAHGIAGSRGPLRDALTVFDENGALLQAPPALVDALRARDWRALFVAERSLWQAARLTLFGHALIEKLVQPRKSITAHVWIVADLDDTSVAASIQPDAFTTRAFLPLPVLGVPGWCAANEDERFYDDAEVFRQPRERPR
jgi:hypothetical protein